jgi:hypothetical protein
MNYEYAYAARCRACILAWIHSASTLSLLNSSLSTAGSILRRNQCLSIAVCFQIRRYAARALRGPGPALAPVLPGRRIRVDTLY